MRPLIFWVMTSIPTLVETPPESLVISKRPALWTPYHQSKLSTPYVVIAGSGESVEGYDGPVTLVTKKRPLPAPYVAASSPNYFHRWRDTYYNEEPSRAMIFRQSPPKYRGLEVGRMWFSAHEKGWEKHYYAQFKPKMYKPSIGTLAVFMAYERWNPKKIGLIGMDWVLDGNPDWFHDAKAELEAISALPVEIVDLRDGRIINGE
jgi:hypothetical protein